MKVPIRSILLALAAVGAHFPATAQAPASPPIVQGTSTQPTDQGGANRAVVLTRADDNSTSMIGTAELAGLELYDLAGLRTGAVPAGEAVGLDLRYSSLTLAGEPVAILAVADATTNSLRFYTPRMGTLEEVTAGDIRLGFAVENVCLYHSAQDGTLYAYAVGDGGEIDQYMVFATPEDRVAARQVRRLHVPSTAEHCVADDAAGALYVSEETVGIWRFDAEPEADVAPALIDAARLGHITEEVGGLALYDGGTGAQWLIAADSSGGRLHIYDRANDDAFVGSVAVGSAQGAAIEEPGGVYATSLSLPEYPNGALIVADEEAPGGARYVVVPFERIAGALGLDVGSPQPAITAVDPTFPIVRPIVETVPVTGAGDAADDPAIWANPDDPAASLIIGTDKQGGLNLYDFLGRSIQFLPDGKMNNVDLREGFALGGERVVLVTASDRTNKAIAIYRLDTANRRLVEVADGVQPTGLSDPYGQCMYRSPRSGKHYVFVSDPDGTAKQWELIATREGKVRIKPVRTFKFASQAEGCVADDATGTLYVAEEDIGLWRLGAEPRAGSAMRSIDSVEANPGIKDDLEGVGIYDLGGGRGYIVVSSQGNDSYAVYRREGDQAYLGSFRVVADGARGIDGISETDGLEVTSRNLGPGLEHGALIAQDGRNVLPSEKQNFKIVPWDAIAAALGLDLRDREPA